MLPASPQLADRIHAQEQQPELQNEFLHLCYGGEEAGTKTHKETHTVLLLNQQDKKEARFQNMLQLL